MTATAAKKRITYLTQTFTSGFTIGALSIRSHSIPKIIARTIRTKPNSTTPSMLNIGILLAAKANEDTAVRPNPDNIFKAFILISFSVI